MMTDMKQKCLESYVTVQLRPRFYMPVNICHTRPFFVIALTHSDHQCVMIVLSLGYMWQLWS